MLFPRGIGIDISDSHIRLAWLTHGWNIEALREIALPPGIVVDEAISKPEIFKTHLSELMNDPELKGLKGNVTVAMPESRVFVSNFWIDSSLKAEEQISEAVKHGQRLIPLPFKQALVDLQFGEKNEARQAAALMAASQDFATTMESTLDVLELPVTGVEARSSAIHRVLDDRLQEDAPGLKLLVDFGRPWVSMSMYDSGGLPVFSRSIKTSLFEDSGEEVLKQQGIAKFCGILQETTRFFVELDPDPISVIVSDDGSLSEELFVACGESLPEFSVQKISDIISFNNLDGDQLQVFCASIGAAMRSAKPRHYKNIHNFKEPLVYEAS